MGWDATRSGRVRETNVMAFLEEMMVCKLTRDLVSDVQRRGCKLYLPVR